jgi:hypothetical protein
MEGVYVFEKERGENKETNFLVSTHTSFSNWWMNGSLEKGGGSEYSHITMHACVSRKKKKSPILSPCAAFLNNSSKPVSIILLATYKTNFLIPYD